MKKTTYYRLWLSVLCLGWLWCGAICADQLPAQINPKTLRGLITTNMDVFESHGVLVIPMRYRFGWRGQGRNESWVFLGYTVNKMDMFGVDYESTKLLKNWNGRLLPDSETLIISPKTLKRFMNTTFKHNMMKKADYDKVDYKADAYLCIRIKPRAHRLRRPYS